MTCHIYCNIVTLIGDDIKKKISNLKEKVYLLMYGKPDYMKNIKEIIYGKGQDIKTVDRIVEKLKEKEWIEKTKAPNGKTTIKKYYIANVKKLFDSILRDLEEKNISLTSEEKKSLKHYLNSESFRATIQEITVVDGKLRDRYIDFSTVKHQLCYLSAYALFASSWLDKRTLGATNDSVGAVMKRITDPILLLEESLLKKLTHLDLYTYFLAIASFEDIRDMIENTFDPALKDLDFTKLEGKGLRKFFIQLKDDSKGNVDYKIKKVK